VTEEIITIVDAGRPVTVPASVTGRTVRLSQVAVRAALGWELGPEGLCRDTVCVPLPPATDTGGDGIDLADLAAALDRPFALDTAERAAYLGVSARDRGEALASLEAPDFSLPDLAGGAHALSQHRGKKVLLVVYASW
jgi:hypothetical protein